MFTDCLCCALKPLILFPGSRPGTPKNLRRAFELFEQSAEQKIGMAQYNLAHFYHSGKGGVVPKDYDKAYRLAKEAIKDDRVSQMKQGDPFYLLGTMYIQVQGGVSKMFMSL